MNTYKISTHNFNGERLHFRWFSTKKEAKDYAKFLVRLGFTPYAESYSPNYDTVKSVVFPSVAVMMYFKGVDF